MLREWAKHSLKSKQIAYDAFLADLNEIVVNQIKRVLARRHMPPAITGDMPNPFPRYPMLGHVAIYTLNLIILRTVLSGTYDFDEAIVGAHEDGARPWDQLSHLWRSWFSIENLNGLAAILTADRREQQIHLVSQQAFRVPASGSRLDMVVNVSSAIGDAVTAGLAGLVSAGGSGETRIPLRLIGEALAAEHIDVRSQVSLRQLFEAAANRNFGEYGKLLEFAQQVIENSLEAGRLDDLRQAVDLMSTRYPLLKGRLRPLLRVGRLWPEALHRWEDFGMEFERLGLGRVPRHFVLGGEGTLHLNEGVEEYARALMEGVNAGGQSVPTLFASSRARTQVTEYFMRTGIGLRELTDSPDATMELFRAALGGVKGQQGTMEQLIAGIEKVGGFGDLAMRRPDVLFEFLTIVSKENRSIADRLLGMLGEGWMEPLLRPLGFIELADRQPDLAVLLLRQLRRRGNGGMKWPISPDMVGALVRGLMDPDVVTEVFKARPTVGREAVLWLEAVGSGFVDPEVTRRWEQCQAASIGRMLEANSEVAIALLRLSRVVRGEEEGRRFTEEVFKGRSDLGQLVQRGYSATGLYSELLQLVRETGGEVLLKRVAELLLEAYGRRKGRSRLLDRMPIGLVGELKRFAEAAGEPRLLEMIDASIAQSLGVEVRLP
jgi:hypothetical protein